MKLLTILAVAGATIANPSPPLDETITLTTTLTTTSCSSPNSTPAHTTPRQTIIHTTTHTTTYCPSSPTSTATPASSIETKTHTTTHTTCPSSSSPTSTAGPLPSLEAFTAISNRPDSYIHLLPLHANGGHFWFLKDTATYCPPQVKHCPPGKETVLYANGTALYVEVPGGQRIYVAPSGALSFTRPHSAYIPPGSSTMGFEYVPGANYGHYYYKDGFMACPVPGDRVQYQIFAGISDAQVPSGNVSDCQGFDFIANKYTGDGFAAWEYT